MGMTRVMIAAVLVAAAGLARRATAGDYSGEKRRIHELMTGQRLDEDGRSVQEVAREDAASGAKPFQRLNAASTPLKVSNVRMTQRANSKWVDVYYDLTGGNGTLCNVRVEMCDDATYITAGTFEGDGIGSSVRPGLNKHFAWNAGADWPDNFSKKVNATITATETELSTAWHTLYVRWGGFGGRDLDICGYWVDNRTDNVGWSWGNGTAAGAYQSYWHGDNTGSGPEQIDVRISADELARERRQRKYRIHFNYYGERGSPCKATVECEGLSKSSKASMRTGTKATSGDPSLTITFDEDGNPVRID